MDLLICGFIWCAGWVWERSRVEGNEGAELGKGLEEGSSEEKGCGWAVGYLELLAILFGWLVIK